MKTSNNAQKLSVGLVPSASNLKSFNLLISLVNWSHVTSGWCSVAACSERGS
jgi:hypothetical protein